MYSLHNHFDKGQAPWTMGRNYYTTTFIGRTDAEIAEPKTSDFYWTYHKFNKHTSKKSLRGSPLLVINNPGVVWEDFFEAVTNIRRFQVILITEWLDFAPPIIENQLGWKTPPKHVLPHEIQAIRTVKKSKVAKSMLPLEEYEIISEENCLDLLLYEIAKRIFLERLSCGE